MTKLFSFFVRVALMLAGLVFLASLLVAALVLLALWSLRAIWARLTGRPVSRWTFHIDRQAVWNRFYRAPVRSPANQRDDADVIDVQAKEKSR
jgi:hypothetical protein